MTEPTNHTVTVHTRFGTYVTAPVVNVKERSQYFAVLLLILFLCGCFKAPPTPAPVPSVLNSLPTKAKTTGCNMGNDGLYAITTWEFPGLTPNDNSAGGSMRGDIKFMLQRCTEVTIIDYAWSSYDQTYYVAVETTNGQTGWISFSTFDFRKN